MNAMFNPYLIEKARNPFLWLCLLTIALVFVYLSQVPLRIQNPQYADQTISEYPITLPFHWETPPETIFTVFGTIYYQPWFHCTVMEIIPDDGVLGIRVNQREVSLTSIRPEALFDYTKGFDYDFRNYLKPGNNQIEFRIKNNGGPCQLIFQRSVHDWRIFTGVLILALIGMATVCLLFSGTSVDSVTALIFAGGLMVRLLYFINTNQDTRSYDVWGHTEYIEYLVHHWTLPKIHQGWQTYQPPLYYFLAATCYKILNLFHITAPGEIWRYLQLLSLFLYMGFLGVALKILDRAIAKLPGLPEANQATASTANSPFLKQKRSRKVIGYIAFALIVFWPSGIMHSVRLGNDVLLYLFFGLSLLYLLKWHEEGSDCNLYLGFSFATLGVMTKSNALPLYVLFGLILLIRFFKAHLRKVAILGLILLLGLGIAFGRTLAEKTQDPSGNLMVANLNGLSPGLKVENKLQNYLHFDWKVYFNEPYTYTWEDKGGRQFFWNFLLKSSLFGEFSFDRPWNNRFMIALSLLLLLLIFYTISSLALMGPYGKGHWIYIATLVVLVLASMAFRFIAPYSCSNDFRYVLPLIIPFGSLFALAIGYHYQRCWRWAARLGIALGGCFTVLSIIHFLTLTGVKL